MPKKKIYRYQEIFSILLLEIKIKRKQVVVTNQQNQHFFNQ